MYLLFWKILILNDTILNFLLLLEMYVCLPLLLSFSFELYKRTLSYFMIAFSFPFIIRKIANSYHSNVSDVSGTTLFYNVHKMFPQLTN